jgi:cell division protein FtsZ
MSRAQAPAPQPSVAAPAPTPEASLPLPEPAHPEPKLPEAKAQQPEIGGLESPPVAHKGPSDDELLDIPAFLRRQAN